MGFPPRGTETISKPILHVEARIRNEGNIIVRTDIVRDEVTKWLLETFAVLSLGQEITSFSDLTDTYCQYLDVVKVMECAGPQQESGAYRLEDVELDVQAYQLHGSESINDSPQPTYADVNGKRDEEGPQARIISLPSKELDGLWESLLFDELIPSTLLRAVNRMLMFSGRKLNTWTINWNRLILLYGPPGTGKTSLCRGLAQKLSIRLGKQFPQSKMVEINAHSLGSKFFSESGKLVARMFDNIENILEEEPDTFVCVFIDEAETLTAKREQSVHGNEPFDAMRAVNALLTALDRLRHRPNVVVLCTSNLITALGLSGRSLRRLPALSLVLHSDYSKCTIEQAVRALALGVEEEKRAGVEAASGASGRCAASMSPNLLACPNLKTSTPEITYRSLNDKRALSSPRLSTPSGSSPLAGIQSSELKKNRASSTSSGSRAESPFYLTLSASAATVTAVGAVAWYYHLYGQEAFAMTPAEEGLHPAKYPWEHTKWTKTFDHQALRRGFQVYREVCMACHSLTRVPWRAFVGTIHTVDEMKAMAEEYEYDTEPNDQGEIEKRPGKLSDYIPPPYKNDEAARAANNSALPPDLSLIVKARHGGCDYIFNLLTGYPDEPPAGATVQEGLNFNPYFPGTGIAMARVLFDGLVEYEDGTPATTSQMAKDVTEFLNWAAEPEMDERKKMGLKTLAITAMLTAISIWVKRYKWAPIKSRKIVYSPPVGRPPIGKR
ncbi:cytochrome c1 [Histoplasma capsulatum G186AR]|uniref:quinol--cytochrome-c reductase n=1 Tax=Ajellomyces capsulatus (strain G186AR / H82 / ATCC MYA-2454 / RMSCC 2432) TaxID=447093 RepID=C0NQD9_AJECG|nr:cytochrome c1 [Histoplasma capsulatum G186AR]EEH06411.1 cytochrome c1 [Histoplasma capsulatum G186AR]